MPRDLKITYSNVPEIVQLKELFHVICCGLHFLWFGSESHQVGAFQFEITFIVLSTNSQLHRKGCKMWSIDLDSFQSLLVVLVYEIS